MTMAYEQSARADVAGMTFQDHLEQALKHYADPHWLGTHSPLAAPYCLGDHLAQLPPSDAGEGVERGRVLQDLLRHTSERLQPTKHYDPAQVLAVSYFEPCDAPEDALYVSRATYYRYRKTSIEALADALIRSLNPSLCLEAPAAPSMTFGRDQIIAECAVALREGLAVAVDGPGGIGKTTLGALLASHIAPRPMFWFTVRPGLNDRLSNLVFSLGYFLHMQGVSVTWRQLIADQGYVRHAIIPGLIRYDLDHFEGTSPVLCLDEIDLLRPTEVEAHAQLLTFIQSLHGQVPILFLGQHLRLEADRHLTLGPLSSAAVNAMLAQGGVQLPAAQRHELTAYIHGNPRLLELFITLHQLGDPLPQALARLSSAPSLEFLLDRIWRRLDEDERALLMALTVFRRPAPADAWPPEVLQRLTSRHLLQRSERGGVTMALAFKERLRHLLSPEDRELLHLKAAAVRAQRGEYTASAYHLVHGGRPELAIDQWRMHQAQEVNQGQASAALALFRDVSPTHLDSQARASLALLKADLYKLTGEYDAARQALRRVSVWHMSLPKAWRYRLEGDVAELTDRLVAARRAYRRGLHTVERLLEEAGLFHKNLGWVAMRQRELDRAWHHAQLARYEAENLRGYVQEEMGHYERAAAHYTEALALAQDLQHAEGEAKTRENLARLQLWLEDFDASKAHWERARRYYERVGNLNRIASLSVNQALSYNLAGHPEAALDPAETALELFVRLGELWGEAVAAQNLAEAHLALGHLAAAEHFAERVVRLEEDHTLPDALRTLGEVKLAQGHLQDARSLVEAALESARSTQNSFLEAYAWRALGRVHLARGAPSEACEALHKAVDLFDQLALPKQVDRTRALLPDAASAGGA